MSITPAQEIFVKNGYKVYRKKTVICAYQMWKHFEVSTLEGIMSGEAGDYLAIGVQGEAYPIKREIFEQTYEEVT